MLVWNESTMVHQLITLPSPGELVVLTAEDGGVSSGTLEELIHELVPRAHSTPSENFQFAFLLSSRLFMTPTRLMVRTFSNPSRCHVGMLACTSMFS